MGAFQRAEQDQCMGLCFSTAIVNTSMTTHGLISDAVRCTLAGEAVATNRHENHIYVVDRPEREI